MSDPDSATPSLPEPAASPGPTPPPVPPAAPAPRRGGAAGPLALVLALLALAASAWAGWQLWQLRQGDQAGSTALAALRQRVAALDSAQSRLDAANNRARQALADADKQDQALQTRVAGLADRTRSLENAVATLSSDKLSAHDATALDETESLLRMADARYTLFHDADGAMKAYALAGRTLATVDDPAFAGVRQDIDRERAALAATHPAMREDALATLAQVRAQVSGLPLRPLDQAPATAADGFWQRTWQALSHLVRVHRDDGAPTTLIDARLARELAALDVAQAQAALLADDDATLHAALARADDALARDFDATDPGVQQVRSELARLKSVGTGAPPQLGAALDELRNVRRVRDAGSGAPAGATSARTPATAASSGGGRR